MTYLNFDNVKWITMTIASLSTIMMPNYYKNNIPDSTITYVYKTSLQPLTLDYKMYKLQFYTTNIIYISSQS